MALILKSAPVVENSLNKLRDECAALKKQDIVPSMKVILVGNNPASILYTNNKRKFCEKFGAKCEIIKLSEDLSPAQFLAAVADITQDKTVHGCFIQLPLPQSLSHIDVSELLPTEKDVDGFTKSNIMQLFQGDIGENALLPCTPKGIITLCEHYNIPLAGANVVVIGRSHIVGRPMSLLLTNHNATVTLCHSRTVNLKQHTQRADIIISAVGKPRFFNKSYLAQDKKPYLIDVGINRDEHNKLCGDIDFDDVINSCAGVTPVPGGVGPLTILSLAQNLIQATKQQMENV